MMSYRDTTFCTGDGCTKFDTCPRALTPVVEAAARRWWGGDGAPISRFAEPAKLDCYVAPAEPYFDPTDPTLPIES
jgi:hypothetical protein